jgi:hypothetical protein
MPARRTEPASRVLGLRWKGLHAAMDSERPRIVHPFLADSRRVYNRDADRGETTYRLYGWLGRVGLETGLVYANDSDDDDSPVL